MENEVPRAWLVFIWSQYFKIINPSIDFMFQNEFMLQMSYFSNVRPKWGQKCLFKLCAVAMVTEWESQELWRPDLLVTMEAHSRHAAWVTEKQDATLGGMFFLSFGACSWELPSICCSSSAWVVRWLAFFKGHLFGWMFLNKYQHWNSLRGNRFL